MDISALTGQYQGYVPFSSSAAQTVQDLNSPGNFNDILKRTQKASSGKAAVSPASNSTHSPGSSKKNDIDKTSKLYEQCQELETFLIKNLIKSMRDTVQKSNLIDTGFAGGMYEDMLYDEYAKSFSKNANFGFAEMAYRQLAGK
ncbi:MAG: rod-binding protein [Treponema sp.]|nr:rod-binding protein [Treponema sp.]